MVTIHSKSLGRLVLQITAASLKLGTIYNVESDLTSTFYDCSVVFVARLINMTTYHIPSIVLSGVFEIKN